MKNVMDYILQRRSIRKFNDKEVKKEDINSLLQAAMAAPSSCNKKTWEFIVTTDKDILLDLREALENKSYNPSLAITVCGNMDIASCNQCAGLDGQCKDFWVQDCSAAMENILIAAAGFDLGSVWVGVYPLKKRTEQVSNILSIPTSIVPLGIAYIGYPDEIVRPRTQYDENKVHWQTYR